MLKQKIVAPWSNVGTPLIHVRCCPSNDGRIVGMSLECRPDESWSGKLQSSVRDPDQTTGLPFFLGASLTQFAVSL